MDYSEIPKHRADGFVTTIEGTWCEISERFVGVVDCFMVSDDVTPQEAYEWWRNSRDEPALSPESSNEAYRICDNCKRILGISDRRAVASIRTATLASHAKALTFAPYYTLCAHCAEGLNERAELNNMCRRDRIYWAYRDRAPDYGDKP